MEKIKAMTITEEDRKAAEEWWRDNKGNRDFYDYDTGWEVDPIASAAFLAGIEHERKKWESQIESARKICSLSSEQLEGIIEQVGEKHWRIKDPIDDAEYLHKLAVGE